MKKIKVNLKKIEDRSYDILIGEDILKKIPLDLKKEKPAYSYVIISDSVVASLYGQKLLRAFTSSGLNSHIVSFPAGELHKNRDT
ncbi:MAG TPA: hypothetical protein VIH27_02975, partial [Nitrososphaerales archaeon]